MKKVKDLTGKRFNNLTVIGFDRIEYKRDSKGKNRDKRYWKCKCDCGKELSVLGTSLTTGDKKSCGCMVKEAYRQAGEKRRKDLTGKKFGKLTVLGLDRVERVKRKNGDRNKFYWKCRCECGKEFVLNYEKLKSGQNNSCKDIERNQTQTYTEIGTKHKRKNVLKEGTRLDTLTNKPTKANTSGVRGVYYDKDKGKYKVYIDFKNKRYYLGYYDKLEDAAKARARAEDKFFKPILEKYNYNNKNIKEEENEEEFE